MLQPTPFVVGLPGPCFRSGPGESDRLKPNPAALAEGRPSGPRSRLPDRTVIFGGEPFTGMVEVETASRRGGFSFIEPFAPPICIQRRDLPEQRKMGRGGNGDASRLSLMEVHFG